MRSACPWVHKQERSKCQKQQAHLTCIKRNQIQHLLGGLTGCCLLWWHFSFLELCLVQQIVSFVSFWTLLRKIEIMGCWREMWENWIWALKISLPDKIKSGILENHWKEVPCICKCLRWNLLQNVNHSIGWRGGYLTCGMKIQLG